MLFPLLSFDAGAHSFDVLFAIALTMSGWPIARSAGCWFCPGIEFHTRMRLYPRSATNRWTPSEVTEAGLSMLFACGATIWVGFGATLKPDCPSTTSAG